MAGCVTSAPKSDTSEFGDSLVAAHEVGTGNILVYIDAMSGQTESIELPVAGSLQDLYMAVAAKPSSRGKRFRLVLGTSVLPNDSAVELQKAGVADRVHINVVLHKYGVPSHFKMDLIASHERREGILNVRRRYSSAFTMVYELHINIPSSHISGKVMRKYETDTFIVDGQQGRQEGTIGHHMSGSSPFTSDCPCFDLSKVLATWTEQIEEVSEPERRIWAITEEEYTERHDGNIESNWRTAGWFAAPSSDCIELRLDAPFPVLPREGCDSSLTIAGILLDPAGQPIRAALYHKKSEKQAKMHEEVDTQDRFQRADPNDMARHGNHELEEFDVTISTSV